MTSDQAKTALSGVSIAEGVDTLPSGHVRIETTFRYPDGTSIEIFVAPENLPYRRLTDLGQTTAWLLNGSSVKVGEQDLASVGLRRADTFGVSTARRSLRCQCAGPSTPAHSGGLLLRSSN
jgi:hypothetical protein